VRSVPRRRRHCFSALPSAEEPRARAAHDEDPRWTSQRDNRPGAVRMVDPVVPTPGSSRSSRELRLGIRRGRLFSERDGQAATEVGLRPRTPGALANVVAGGGLSMICHKIARAAPQAGTAPISVAMWLIALHSP